MSILIRIVLMVSLLTAGMREVLAEVNGKTGMDFRNLRLIPVLSGGRLKPFDEFARENILLVTGSRDFQGFDPSEWMLSVMTDPKAWMNVPLVRVGMEEVRKQLLLDPNRKFFSAHEILQSNAFLQYAESMSTGGSQVGSSGIDVVNQKANPRAEELKRVIDRMNTFQALMQGHLWTISPSPEGWGTLAQGITSPTDSSKAVYEMLKAYLDSNPSAFSEAAFRARSVIEAQIPGFAEDHQNLLKVEVFYNRFRPFLQAMIFYLLAGLAWIFAVRFVLARHMAKFLTFAAVMIHVIGFACRCYVAGRPPVTNMYESIIWVSLGVMVFALVLATKFKQPVLLSTGTLIAGISLLAADAAPMVMDPTIRPLVPVLRSNYWLTVHVLTITLSYGAFFLAMGISNIALFLLTRVKEIKISQRVAYLNNLSYRAMQIGVVLLAAGTILGGIWADYSWGRFWGWDPKEVWALIALLAYVAILHGRFAGWVGTFAFPLWTVIGFATVVMAWYGVNFVLGVGLHSYGFSSGGQLYVSLFLLIQGAYCGWATWKHRQVKVNA